MQDSPSPPLGCPGMDSSLRAAQGVSSARNARSQWLSDQLQNPIASYPQMRKFVFISASCEHQNPNLEHYFGVRQKCDPDRCAQNSHKSRLCFITHHTFPIFIPLAVPWGSNLDPCGKNVILTGARKIRIKVVYVFLPVRHFPFSFVCLFLGIPTWILVARMWSWQARAKFI